MNYDVITQIENDGPIGIAVGNSRTSKKWVNKQMTWSDLLRKFSSTKRTPETVEEYRRMTRDEQSEIKDVGGFVGGNFKDGRRIAENLVWRSIISLDVDFPEDGFWQHVTEVLKGKACCLYSTHKHTPEVGKYRLIIPLAKSIKPEEYEPISRMVAHLIGIDQFDDTTYQAHRLMYWPSTSKDGEFIFEHSDGAWLDPDEILARYENWQDISSWPVSSRQTKELTERAGKQEDPLTKPGIIGAFCRAYDIHEAIYTFLPDEYVQCDVTDRYTYSQGSTSAGAVVYDDKFLYSHHSTDPGCEQLLNAFDLVRVHKFGYLDTDTRAKGDNLPSFKAMMDLAAKDEKVRVELIKEGMASFEDLGDEEKENLNTWLPQLEVHYKTGKNLNTAKNVLLILGNDIRLQGTFGLNEFTHRISVIKDLPWRKCKGVKDVWSDIDDSALRNFISNEYNITGTGLIFDAFNETALKNRFHPVREYLNNLVWDGTPRLDTLFIDFLGGDDTELTRAMTRKAFMAAVQRIHHPGVKFDTVITLIGGQGIGKSHIIRKMSKDWCNDSMSTIVGKEAMESIQGFWFIELAELSAMRKAESEQVKQFLSKSEDSFRPAYGRNVETHGRQCIFFATTNNDAFIRDETGGRRWWPINVDKQRRTKDIFVHLTEYYIDQVWAEAVALNNTGEKLILSPELEQEVLKLQQQHADESPLAGLIREFLDKHVPTDWDSIAIEDRANALACNFGAVDDELVLRDKICAQEIWVECLGGDLKNYKRINAQEINGVLMRTEGWKRDTARRRYGAYGQQRGFTRDVKKQ